MFKKIAIFGVGLIGGSFALALKKAQAVQHIVGVGRSANSLLRAQQLGIIDSMATSAATSLSDAIHDADLILIAAPVAQTGSILSAIAPHLSPRTIVTDAGSTKCDVIAAARLALGDKIAQLVPAHPIAGREMHGPEAALADLYQGKKTVITSLTENTPQAIEMVAAAWRHCGAVIHELTPEQHDGVFAAVSHLPHLLAYALVDEIANKPHAELLFQYAASGFRDFTRIAGSSPEMWRDISLANQAALLVELDAYMAQLATLRHLLASGDGAALQAIYANAQQARQNWGRAIESAESVKSAAK